MKPFLVTIASNYSMHDDQSNIPIKYIIYEANKYNVKIKLFKGLLN